MVPKENTVEEFPTLWDMTRPSTAVGAQTTERDSCCLYWNLGLDCAGFLRSGKQCNLSHTCSDDECRQMADSTHRAIQHRPKATCEGQNERMKGMNYLHPEPLLFHPKSSPDDTREACEKYGVRQPSLNAKLFQELLRKTNIPVALQDSLVRGWKEGLDLGAELPHKDHFVEEPSLTEDQLKVLQVSLNKECEEKKLIGPLAQPIRDGRWFLRAWVSPYFVIPRKQIPGAPLKWRLIHHLSFHSSGFKELSLNGSIDMSRFPTSFPTHLTGAHLIF